MKNIRSMKNAERIRGNHQFFDASTSYSVPPRHISRNRSGQHFQPAALSHPMPYIPAPNVNESSFENMGPQRIWFPHPPPLNPQYHSFHHLTPPMQWMRGHSTNIHPPVTAASYRVPTNPSHSAAAIPIQNGFVMGARHVGPAPSTGLRFYQPQTQRVGVPETTFGHQNLPPVGFIQVDDVALLVDHHSNMRMDIEDMSYEELLALGERIGNVSTGLSKEIITSQMKTKIYSLPADAINLEEAASEEQETDCCIICQDEYKNRDSVGILQCGHEYHADCLRKWLLVKNVCPICKSEALTPGGKGPSSHLRSS